VLALSRGAPVIQPESINRPEALESLRAAAPDAIVVTAYGKRLSRRVLALPRLGCFNVHASLLPKYRGAAPIERAIVCGESESGVTIQRMAPKIDAGAVLLQRSLKIGDEETAGELSTRLSALAAEMILPLLDAVESGSAIEQPQHAALATEAPSLQKNDGLVPWRLDARSVCNFIRGMTPWPGAFAFRVSGERRERLILLAARPTDDPVAGAAPGQVLRAGDRLIVATGRGSVALLRVKPEGGKPMDAAAYLRGHAVKPGDFFHGA
jgi:methionyl-tRNA formyltransferase